MKKLCINCLEKTPVELHEYKTTDLVNGYSVEYKAKSYVCLVCDDQVPDNELSNENFETMYNQYRTEKNMFIPRDIKFIREDLYQLSTRYFAKLVGCSPATISRIENGALQSRQHDNQFKLIKDPKNMNLLYHSICDELEDDENKLNIRKRLEDLITAKQVMDLLKGTRGNLDFPTVANSNNQSSYANVESVEEYFIKKNDLPDQNDIVTPLKLQKLLYYSQGWSLAFTGKPLLKNNFQAWVHGPVIKEVYEKYKGFGYEMIESEKSNGQDNLTMNQRLVLDWVWVKYGRFSGKYLEEITHTEDPWQEARGDLNLDQHSNEVILNDRIREYFSDLFENMKLLQKLE